jgi:putative addiction module CopG family antidote
MSNIHISLNPQLLEFVENLVSLGGYGTRSEVINQALRQMQEDSVLLKLQLYKLQHELSLGAHQAEEGNFVDDSLDDIYNQALKSHQNKLNKMGVNNGL